MGGVEPWRSGPYSCEKKGYRLYPSIITGGLASVLPEQLGVWSYPYPVIFRERINVSGRVVSLAEMADGEQTIFNIINGMCGVMYLFGRIDESDGYNRFLICEGVALYKKNGRLSTTRILFNCKLVLQMKRMYTARLLEVLV